MPSEVVLSVSTDGEHFEEVARLTSDVPDDEYGVIRRDLVADLGGIDARFLRVFARNYGTIPDWHPGRGDGDPDPDHPPPPGGEALPELSTALAEGPTVLGRPGAHGDPSAISGAGGRRVLRPAIDPGAHRLPPRRDHVPDDDQDREHDDRPERRELRRMPEDDELVARGHSPSSAMISRKGLCGSPSAARKSCKSSSSSCFSSHSLSASATMSRSGRP